MGFAFTHLIFAWLLGKCYEYISKKKISPLVWFFLLAGAIIPDIDFLLDWTLATELHRTLTHSLLFVLGAGIIVYLGSSFFKSDDKKAMAIAASVGILGHLLLDMVVPYGVPLFWPNLTYFSYTWVGYFDPATPSFLHSSPQILRRALKMAVFDMAIGTAWIFYLMYRRRIQL